HGHNLSKGNIIKIFYHGLNEITQEVRNATTGGIFLYKTPNQAYQLLKDKVLLKPDWAKNQNTISSLKKTVAFTAEGSSNSETDKIMARMDVMTMKMDAQYKEFQSRSKQPNLDDDDIPMSREEEAKFMQTFRHTFMDLKNKLETTTKNHQASIQNLKAKFDRLADKQSGRPSGSLPSNTQPNLKGSSSKSYQPPQAQNEHVNAVFTQSGKSYDPPVNPNDQQNDFETLINFDSDDEDEEPTPQLKPKTPKPKRENGSSIWKIPRHDLSRLNQRTFYRCLSRNNEATSSGSSFMNIDNDGEFASNTLIGEKIDKIEPQICKVVFDETVNLRIPTSGKDGSYKGYGTNSLLEQWRDSYPDNDDYDPYDDDMYENHDLSEHLQSICDDLDITAEMWDSPTSFVLNSFFGVIHLPRKPFTQKNVLAGMPNYGKFLKELVAFSCNALADLGANINLMSYSLYAKLSLKTLKPTKIRVRLADRSFQYPLGIAKNLLVEVGKFTFPADFVILEMEEDSKVPLILGRPFLHTVDSIIRVKQKQLNLRVGTERMVFHIDSTMKHSYSNDDTCFSIDFIDEILEEYFDALLDEGSEILHSIKGTILEEKLIAEFDEFIAMTADENFESKSDTEEPQFEKIAFNTDYKIKTSLEEPSMDLELKPLPDNLEYVFLEEPSFLPVIISSQLSKENKNQPASVLKRHKQAFA
ncbi:reverse transcriptase domain-containing protein, partial [Tanacetum coccineum]